MKTFLRFALPLVVVAVAVVLTQTLIALRPEVKPTTPEIIPPLVEVVRAERSPTRLEVNAQGAVMPSTESRLVSEVSGKIVLVSPSWVNGGFFQEGELLLAIDPVDYSMTEKDAEMRVAQAELRLAQEEADAEIARRDWQTINGDAAPPPLAVREPQVREARATLAAARAALEKAQRDVERCRITAPYAGRVRTKRVDVGEFLQRGTELGRVYATDRAEIRLPLPDAELAFLDLSLEGRDGPSDGPDTLGPAVTLVARFGGESWTWYGTIVRTEGELDPESRMVVLVCEVEDPYGLGEDEDRPPLSVGMFVDATIRGREAPEAVALPRSALRSGGRVFVVEEVEGVEYLDIRPVEVLRTERERVLLAGGVDPGECIVVSPVEAAVDGMNLRTISSDGGEGSR